MVPSDLSVRAAIDDGHALPAFDLVDGLVVADEEAALGDVPLGRRRREGGRRGLADAARPRLAGVVAVRAGGRWRRRAGSARSPLADDADSRLPPYSGSLRLQSPSTISGWFRK